MESFETQNLSTHAKPAALEVRSLKYFLPNDRRTVVAPYQASNIELLWITKGSGILAQDLEKVKLEPGTACCITPGQIYSLTMDENTDGHLLSFSNEFLVSQPDIADLLYNSGLFCHNSKTPVIHVKGEVYERVNDIIQRIIKECQNCFHLRNEILKGLMRIFLIDLTRLAEKPCESIVKTRNADLVKRFLVSLDKKYSSTRMVLDYAEELSVTPNNLNDIVKKVTGFPASYHIQQRVAKEAKRQAAYEVTTMKEIALKLGFEDFAHFSRFFKKNVGMNFTDYKRQLTGVAA